MVRGVSFDRDHQLGQVAVADDPPELLLGDEHPAAVQRLRMSLSRQALDVALRVADDLDHRLQGFVEHSVLASLPVIPSRITQRLRHAFRNEPVASGQVRSSSRGEQLEALLGQIGVLERRRAADPGQDRWPVALGEQIATLRSL